MGYSREQIIEKCKSAVEEDSTFETFYAQDFVKNIGKTTDDNSIFYTEVVSDFLVSSENIKLLKAIKPKSRHNVEKSYNVLHDGKLPKNPKHTNEKVIAIDLFNQSLYEGALDYVGQIIDYQTPLKSVRGDSYGEIDLLAINKEDRLFYILELKREDSTESLLRCILEAYTYYKLVDIDDLLNDFNIDKDEYHGKIKISPIVFKKNGDKEGVHYKEWKELKEGKRPNLSKLITELDIEVAPFFLSKRSTGCTYDVTID